MFVMVFPGFRHFLLGLRSDDAVDILQEIPSLRMIDVLDQCITLAPRQCVYVALSYVWGRIDPQRILRTVKSNIADLEEPNSLQKPEFYDKIPVTIRDAMVVVKELHMRYLWVDSLCIIQDNDGEGGSKMEAIAKMAYVYGAASLTITAASGIDANAGLPGVHPGTDRSQPIEEIEPGFRLAVVVQSYTTKASRPSGAICGPFFPGWLKPEIKARFCLLSSSLFVLL